jgi:NAD(P)-dependent dehydrogenase (short-subunit alcohol dehydrogenase family)
MNEVGTSRVWLITGCSTGIGRELAEAALVRGDRVIVTARKVEQTNDLVQQYPKTARGVRLDVTDSNSIEMAIQVGLESFGTIDIVVNNAGYGLRGAVEEVNDVVAHEQFETNFFGVLNVQRAILPIFRARCSGHIINISSVGGRLTVPYLGLYHASKFALEGMSEALAPEVKPFGIKVTIVEPGGFETDFWGRSAVEAAPMTAYDFLREQMQKYSSGSIRGDAATGVQAIIKVVDMPDPPLRVVIGPNALPRVVQKLTMDIEDYNHHEDLWLASTKKA